MHYYWLKLKETFFEEDTIDFLESQEDGEKLIVFYLKLCCKSLKDEGRLMRYVGKTVFPYDAAGLAKITKTDVVVVGKALKIFLETGLVERLATGELYITQINEMIGSECDSAERVRKLRAKKEALQCNSDVTEEASQCDSDVTEEASQCDSDVTEEVLQCNKDVTKEMLQCDVKALHCNTDTLQCNSDVTEEASQYCYNVQKCNTDIDIELEKELEKDDFDFDCNGKPLPPPRKPSPEEVHRFYLDNRLGTLPSEFYNYNSRFLWLDKNCLPIENWRGAYIEFDRQNPDPPPHDPELAFSAEDYEVRGCADAGSF